MKDVDLAIDLTLGDLRAVTGYAAACAREVLHIFEAQRPGDLRPRRAIDTAQAFADGAKRTKALRDCAWDTQRAVSESHDARANAASEAARSALAAAGAAFLHPIAKATQVKHILGSAAHAARAIEISGGDDHEIGKAQLETLLFGDLIRVREVLCRYPEAPPGGGRVGELIRHLDALLRAK